MWARHDVSQSVPLGRKASTNAGDDGPGNAKNGTSHGCISARFPLKEPMQPCAHDQAAQSGAHESSAQGRVGAGDSCAGCAGCAAGAFSPPEMRTTCESGVCAERWLVSQDRAVGKSLRLPQPCTDCWAGSFNYSRSQCRGCPKDTDSGETQTLGARAWAPRSFGEVTSSEGASVLTSVVNVATMATMLVLLITWLKRKQYQARKQQRGMRVLKRFLVSDSKGPRYPQVQLQRCTLHCLL